MTPDLKDVLTLLEKIAPFSLSEDWDNSGIQVGDPSLKIRKILIALDPTMEAVHFASEMDAQLLLTHHPLIFKPIQHLEFNQYPGNVICEAIKNRLAVVSVHTNLDIAKGGINDILAELLHLQRVEVLQSGDYPSGAGLGRIGDFAKPYSLSDVVDIVQKTFRVDTLRVVFGKSSRICRVAIIGGSGANFIVLAHKMGADLLITGDVNHHNALDAKAYGINLIDPGHFFTEKIAFDIFAGSLMKHFLSEHLEIAVEIFEDEEDPIRIV